MRTYRQSRAIGQKKQAVGSAFEKWVETQHEIGKMVGLIAHAEHTQASARVVGGKLIYTASGVADYILCSSGIGASAGRYIAVEAKSVLGARLPKANVKPLQRRHLDAVAGAGGVAILLVEFRMEWVEGGVRRFALPWRYVPWQTVRTAESLSVTDIDTTFLLTPSEDCYLRRFV